MLNFEKNQAARPEPVPKDACTRRSARCSRTVLCSLLSYLLVYQPLGDEGQFAGRNNPQADSSELDICCLLEHMEKNGAGDFSAVS